MLKMLTRGRFGGVVGLFFSSIFNYADRRRQTDKGDENPFITTAYQILR